MILFKLKENFMNHSTLTITFIFLLSIFTLNAEPLKIEEIRRIISVYNNFIKSGENNKAIEYAQIYFPTEVLKTSVINGKAYPIAGINALEEKKEKSKERYSRVTQVFSKETNELVEVTLKNSEVIKTTKEHPFMVKGQGWTEAKNIKSGDSLIVHGNKLTQVDSVKVTILDKPVKVYNFEVEDTHNYYVGETGVLVHNECENRTRNTIFVKNGDNDELQEIKPGNKSSDSAYKNNRFGKPDSEDGIVDPKNRPGKVYKVPDGFNSIVHSDGRIELAVQPGLSFTQSIIANAARIYNSGWKDVNFLKERWDKGDFGWNTTFQKSGLDVEKEYETYKKSKAK
jgi:hypothetical protein